MMIPALSHVATKLPLVSTATSVIAVVWIRMLYATSANGGKGCTRRVPVSSEDPSTGTSAATAHFWLSDMTTRPIARRTPCRHLQLPNIQQRKPISLLLLLWQQASSTLGFQPGYVTPGTNYEAHARGQHSHEAAD
jgi:hypothetical protein